MTRIDFGRYSDDYAASRPGPPASFYDRLDALSPLRGARALDLATGPGTIALEIATRGGTVTGLDIAPGQIAAADRVARQRGLEGRARFLVGRAEETGQPSGAFDLVTAGQCWHWFDARAALAEARRVLRPEGLLVIVHYSYLAEHSPLAHDTENLILKLNPSWSMAGETGVYPDQIDGVIRGGFRFVEAFCDQHDEVFSHQRWRARMRTCNGVGSGEGTDEMVRLFDEALDRLLKDRYPDPVTVEHRVWCVVARRPS